MDLHFSYIGPFIDFKLSLPDKGLVALVGPSGTGKSSLLAGIHWILTGEPRNITHLNATSKSKIFGQLKYKQLSIIRSKKPDRLEVKDGDLFLDNKDSAQNHLNKKFGQNNVIEASSYLPQKSFHPLLQLSSSDRLSLITNLVWTETSPEDYMEKVDKQLKILMDKLPSLSAEVEYTRKQLEEEFKKDWDNFSDCDYDAQIKNNEKLVIQAKLEQNKYHQIVGKLSSLQIQVDKLSSQPPTDSLQQLQDQLKKYQRQQSLTGTWQKSIILQKKLLEFPDCSIDVEKYSLKKIIRQEMEYQQQKTLAEKFKIEYTEASINNAIKQASEDEKIYSYRQTEEKIKNVENKLQPSKYSIEELNILKQESQLLTCPSCETNLKYQDNQLIKYSKTVSREKINFEDEIKKCKKYQQDCSTIMALKSLLPKLDNLSPVYQLEQAKEILNLKYITAPTISSKNLEQAIERQQIMEKIKMLGPVDHDFSPTSSLEELKLEIKKLEEHINSTIRTEKEYQQYRQITIEKEKLEIEKSLLGFEENRLIDLEKENEKLKLKIKEREEIKQWKIKEERFLPREEQLKQLRLDVEDFGIIREVMSEVQYNLLDNVLIELNCILTTALDDLFTEKVNIEISRFKEAKASKNVKSSINLIFKLKALESDSIRILSGGQLDRVSMALLLAFANQSSVPWILIDEHLASLNDELREKTRTVIRRHTDKLVLISTHNDVLGDYDCVINVEEHI